MTDLVITEAAPARMGLLFSSPVVHATVPKLQAGCYCLFEDSRPVNIGRSDHCVRNRLSTHPLLGRATHFTWQPAPTAWSAFCLEAAWWHQLQTAPPIFNQIHPARPSGATRPCPFCANKDVAAIERTLSWRPCTFTDHSTNT